jgi:predicted GNAT superfamily acetyltransferase
LGDNAGPAHPTKEGALEAKGDSRPREGTKLAAVIALLVRPDGASLDEMIAATEWLPHTTRAALTGLRKRGYAVERRRIEGKTRYAIAASHKAKAA